MNRHFFFEPETCKAFTIPNSDPYDQNMRIFIPLDVDFDEILIKEVRYNIKESGLLLLKFDIICNINYIGKEKVKFCCIQIDNVHFRTRNNIKSSKDIADIKMIVVKTKVKNKRKIPNSNMKLIEVPEWENAIKLVLGPDGTPIIDKEDIPVINDPLMEFDTRDKDSCTIPPR